MKLGAFDYIAKPFDFGKVYTYIQKALEGSQLKREIKHLRGEQSEWFDLPNIVAVSKEMGRVLQIAEKLAQSDTAVLIQGESGTGKELVARAIHERSKRASMPFIAVNCPGFPEQMLENELCGHEKGAFTDAREVKKGFLEMARGGTIFFNEIGDMDMNLQGKILRLIDQKSFRRMGGFKDMRVDVRIVTATNKDMLNLKKGGKFREDLFYRINAASLRIPPLRERPDDILPLTKHFVQKYNEVFYRNVQNISERVGDFLKNYDWPGNVRELKNVIERAMLIGEGDTLLTEHLPIEILG